MTSRINRKYFSLTLPHPHANQPFHTPSYFYNGDWQVANGASDLLGEVFGKKGIHARTAVGVNALPRGAAVEIDAIVEVS